VKTLVVGDRLRRDATDEERARRCETIAAQLVAFARLHGVTECWLEGYAFSQRTASHTLGEVGGVVRLELVRAGIAIRTANMSSARKLLLGKLPRKGAKHAVHTALHAAGSPAWTLDEADAFVAVNLGLSEHAGAWCFVSPEAA
jgi:Holliday junction resolvasome RuvABC endonuclease subunit